MKVTIVRCDYRTGFNGGYQIRYGRGPGKSLFCGDGRCGGKEGALLAAEEVKHALVILTNYFPDLSVNRESCEK